ncbi:MAG: pantoate kinase [Candidatus Geothermarchaeales archaeon]
MDRTDFLRVGSRGAGVCLKAGVTTRVSPLEANQGVYEVRINGKRVKRAPVSEWVVRHMLRLAQTSPALVLEHQVEVPIGCGYGTSASAALSLAFALNDLLDLNLSRVEASQIAHLAEVNCNTGLGTVSAEVRGGFEIRLEPGAPGVGETRSIQTNGPMTVVSLCLGPLETASFLSDPNFALRVNGIGKKMVHELNRNPDSGRFLELSSQFTSQTRLATPRMKQILDLAREGHQEFAMAMLGETIFTVVPTGEEAEVVRHLGTIGSESSSIIVSEVEPQGARPL